MLYAVIELYENKTSVVDIFRHAADAKQCVKIRSKEFKGELKITCIHLKDAGVDK